MSDPMVWLQWWMRIVGVFYLVLCAGVLTRQPIKAEGPAGVLARAAEGDPTARFVIDTWVSLGLLIGVLGTALLIASRHPAEGRVLACTIVGVELGWGVVIDVYKMARGYRKAPFIGWITIHAIIAGSGIYLMTRGGHG